MKTNSPACSLSSAWKRFVILPCVAGCLCLGLLPMVCTTQAQSTETIAHYTFSDGSGLPASLFKDSSGNGNNLTWGGAGSGVAISDDHDQRGASAHSISFPTAHGIAYGVVNGPDSKKLSEYTSLTFDWYMKTPDTRADIGVIFQVGTSSSAVGFVSIQLLANPAVGEGQTQGPTTLRVSQMLSNNKYAISNYTLSDVSSWSEYRVIIDNSIIGADHIRFYVDGAFQTTSSVTLGTVTGTFLDDIRIGGPGTSNNRPFVGNMQDFVLSGGPAIPEPATSAALAGVFVLVLAAALHLRRHRG